MALCNFLGRARALKAIYSWTSARRNEPSYFGFTFLSLGFFGLILGRFRDAVLPDFSRFPAVPTITRKRFTL